MDTRTDLNATFAALRSAYDEAFETLCMARRELDRRAAAGADAETIRCFEGILASAYRECRRRRNAMAKVLMERRNSLTPCGDCGSVAESHSLVCRAA